MPLQFRTPRPAGNGPGNQLLDDHRRRQRGVERPAGRGEPDRLEVQAGVIVGAAQRRHEALRGRVRGAAGKGFKTPTFTEQFAQGVATGNPDLDPEESFSWEVGFDQVFWNNKLVFGATYFRQKFDDLITFINRPGPAPDFENIQESESQGIELMALCKPGYGFTVGANYTYLNTEVEDDGGGFDVGTAMAAARQRKTMGLITIIEQVEMLGGEIKYDSGIGRGTAVHLSLPI